MYLIKQSTETVATAPLFIYFKYFFSDWEVKIYLFVYSISKQERDYQ